MYTLSSRKYLKLIWGFFVFWTSPSRLIILTETVSVRQLKLSEDRTRLGASLLHSQNWCISSNMFAHQRKTCLSTHTMLWSQICSPWQMCHLYSYTVHMYIQNIFFWTLFGIVKNFPFHHSISTKWVTESTKWVTESTSAEPTSTSGVTPNRQRGSRQLYVSYHMKAYDMLSKINGTI